MKRQQFHVAFTSTLNASFALTDKYVKNAVCHAAEQRRLHALNKFHVSQEGKANTLADARVCTFPCDAFTVRQQSRSARLTLPSLSGLIVVYFTLFPTFYFFVALPLPKVKGQTVAQLEEEQASFRLERVWTETSSGLFPAVRPVCTPPALADAEL